MSARNHASTSRDNASPSSVPQPIGQKTHWPLVSGTRIEQSGQDSSGYNDATAPIIAADDRQAPLPTLQIDSGWDSGLESEDSDSEDTYKLRHSHPQPADRSRNLDVQRSVGAFVEYTEGMTPSLGYSWDSRSRLYMNIPPAPRPAFATLCKTTPLRQQYSVLQGAYIATDSRSYDGQPQSSPPPSVLHTDSGYASMSRQVPLIDRQGTVDVNTSTWDTQTAYSGVSLETSRKEGFVQAFADLIFTDLGSPKMDTESVSRLCDGMQDLLSDFAVRLGQETASMQIRKAMVFIHRYRSSISATLEDTISAMPEDEVPEPDASGDKMQINELMQMWDEKDSREATTTNCTDGVGANWKETRFACPYVKYNAARFGSVSRCALRAYENIQLLMHHLTRFHRKYQCERCGCLNFAGDDELRYHVVANRCQNLKLVEQDYSDGFNEAQQDTLLKCLGEQDENETWEKVYRIIFELDDDRPVPSPDFDRKAWMSSDIGQIRGEDQAEVKRSSTDDVDELPDAPNEIQSYKQSVSSTLSYQWLVTTLRHRQLHSTPIGITQRAIQEEVRKSLPKPKIITKAAPMPLTHAIFDLQCKSKSNDCASAWVDLGSIITITGSSCDAQAQTCREYVRHVWPAAGFHIIDTIQEALMQHEYPTIVCELPDGSYVTAVWHEKLDRLRITILGIQETIVAVAEQLCWMTAVLNGSPIYEGLVHCLPSISCIGASQEEAAKNTSDMIPKLENLNIEEAGAVRHVYIHDFGSRGRLRKAKKAPHYPPVHFSIWSTHRRVPISNESGCCWHSMFRSCVIIEGFPIQKRSKSSLGLEIPLNLAVELIGTKYINKFSEYTFIKGFHLMLAPADFTDDMTIWHLCRTNTNDAISYLDHGIPQLCKIDPHKLAKSRHIIGWCANIANRCGMANGDYEVETPSLESTGMKGALYNCDMTFGRPITGGVDFRLTPNHQPISASRKSYLDMFRYLENRFVLFWDARDGRGWLVNGLRALLHLIRQSLVIDENDDRGGLFVLDRHGFDEPEDPGSTYAAREFLSQKNLSTRIAVSSHIGTSGQEYEILEDRLQQFFDVLEKAFIYQKKCTTWSQIPRGHLEGWDFVCLARKEDCSEALLCPLPSIGKGWVDFTRAIGAVTLFGDNFGELLAPKGHSCTLLSSNKYNIAVSTTDLQRIMAVNRCNQRAIPRFISRSPPILWHSPPGSLKLCSNTRDHDAIPDDNHVQVTWPKQFTNLLPTTGDVLDLEDHRDGAVIFGYHDTLTHYVGDFGPPILGKPPDPFRELEVFDDSCLGSSIEDRMAGSWPETSLSPPAAAYKPGFCGQAYGDNTLSGSCAVFGNVPGHFTVNQYFGSGPQHTRPMSQPTSTHHLLSPPPVSTKALSDGRTFSDSAIGTLTTTTTRTSQPSSMEDDEPRTTGIDVEMEEAELEIKDMGLEGYCRVLRL